MTRILAAAHFSGAMLLATGVVAEVPMPLPRPGLAASVPPKTPQARPAKRLRRVPEASGAARSDITLSAEEDEAPCTELLASGFATVELNAAISARSGDALCGDLAPVRMTAIKLPGGGQVELRPAAVARCGMALEFARWVREDLAQSVSKLGASLQRIEIAASYSCRPRNNVSGARLSEHGLANAIDVGAFLLDDGRRIAIEDPKAPLDLFGALRQSACARFTTVLGPGADASHTNHMHLDLARRRGGYRLCQWPYAEWLIP